MKKSKLSYLNRPLQTSSISQYETERQDTQHILIENIAIHRYNSSLLSNLINQKENIMPRGTCSLLPTSPILSILKAPLHKSNTKERCEISLIRKGLSKLPCDLIMRYKNIEVLDLRDNEFVRFPEEILYLEGLTALRLDSNYIEVIPSGIYKLSLLKILTLSKNSIKCLTPSIARLNELVTLSVNENVNLKEWPTWLSDLPRLITLHIQDNKLITVIPSSLNKMSNLIELGFDWFCYILPNYRKIATKKDEVLEELKDLCKDTDKLSFKRFAEHFVDKKKFVEGRNILHMASIWNHIEIIKELSDKSINERDNLGHSALILAMKYNRLEAIDTILQSPYIHVSDYNKKHGSALHLAILKSLWRLCKKLIHHPTFNPNIKDSKGNTALHLLVSVFGRDSVIIEKLCKEILKHPLTNPNIKNHCGLTAVHYAAKKNQQQAINFIIRVNKESKNKFDLSVAGGEQKFTLLHFLVQNSNIEGIVNALNAGVNVFMTDALGRTARDLVSNTMIVRLLRRFENQVRKTSSKIITNNVRENMIINRVSLLSNKKKCNLVIDESIVESVKVVKYNKPSIFERMHRKSEVETQPHLSRLTMDNINDSLSKSTADETVIFKVASNKDVLWKILADNTILNAPISIQLSYIYHIFKENKEDAEYLLHLAYKSVKSKNLRSIIMYLLNILKSKKCFASANPKPLDLLTYYEQLNELKIGVYAVKSHLRNMTERDSTVYKHIGPLRNIKCFNKTVKQASTITKKTLSYF